MLLPAWTGAEWDSMSRFVNHSFTQQLLYVANNCLSDFNECKIESTCDQLCKNTLNSFECSCVTGYTKNNNRCFGINGNSLSGFDNFICKQ